MKALTPQQIEYNNRLSVLDHAWYVFACNDNTHTEELICTELLFNSTMEQVNSTKAIGKLLEKAIRMNRDLFYKYEKSIYADVDLAFQEHSETAREVFNEYVDLQVIGLLYSLLGEKFAEVRDLIKLGIIEIELNTQGAECDVNEYLTPNYMWRIYCSY